MTRSIVFTLLRTTNAHPGHPCMCAMELLARCSLSEASCLLMKISPWHFRMTNGACPTLRSMPHTVSRSSFGISPLCQRRADIYLYYAPSLQYTGNGC